MSNSKIIIKRNPNGDTRTAPDNVSFEDFQEANDSHIADVYNVMRRFSELIEDAGSNHDNTKKSHEKEFYDDFIEAKKTNGNFAEMSWYKLHVKEERHHLLSRCPDDVNLVDVLEMIADCTCAGLARSGEVRPMEINSEILAKAVENTSKLILDMVKVED